MYPDVTLQYAREQLQEARQLLARGIDPSAQRPTVKIARADTFKVIAKEWLEMQAERLAPITMSKARWSLGSFVYPRLGSRPFRAIGATHEQNRERSAGGFGPATTTPTLTPAKYMDAISRGKTMRSGEGRKGPCI